MAIMQFPPVYQTVCLVMLAYIIYHTYWEVAVGASRRRLIHKHGCQPVNKANNSLLGQIFDMKEVNRIIAAVGEGRLLETIRDRYKRVGWTHHAKIFFQDWIYTVEAENLKCFLATNFKDFAMPDKRKSAFVPLLGHGIFTTDGTQWQHSREMLRPNFVRNQIADLEILEAHIQHLIKAIPRDCSMTIDLQALFFRLTMDSATEFLFGESINCLVENDSPSSLQNSEFAGAFERSQHEISRRLRSGFLDTQPKQFKADVKLVHNFVDRFVRRGLKYREAYNLDREKAEAGLKGQGRYVFMNELVKRVGDPIRIRTELLNIMLAGRDTTASLLGNTWFVLARRPDIWNKLRQEVEELKGEMPTYEQIKNMKYLKAVFNESLRLYPVIPLNSRMAIKDTVLPMGGGVDGKAPIFVPKGQIVSYSVYTMHRRKDYFGPDADEFRPERWDGIRPGWEFLPFNGGPRICIGQQFALTEASYTTIRLMQEFKGIEPRDDRSWTENITLTLCGKNGVKVALTPV